MSNKMWESFVEHAKTCVLSGRHYIDYFDETRSIGVVFNNIYEFTGFIANGQYYSAESLIDSQKVSNEEDDEHEYEDDEEWMENAVSKGPMGPIEIIACFSPQLLDGFEENLVNLLKEDNEIIKEGVAHILAKAGGTIREQLATTSSSVDLLLERLCLEGTRKQAKYSVHALAAITKDDGLMSLSVLYKRLVDILEEKTHLPAILQSLGCIAQIATPVFETREDEIFGFIKHKVLECSNTIKEISTSKAEWNERTELCLLKIFSIKTLVKSYLPIRDAHLRPGIEKVMEILKNVLSFGDISKDIKSSAVDKAHLRLASAKAVLRLSRQWDHKIPLDLFYLTLRVSEDSFAQSRKLFVSKVHQYIKGRLLDAKYACAFLLTINQFRSTEYAEGKHNLLEIIQICQQVKVRQHSMQSDGNSMVAYPEYILVYLVHALAHHPLCPNIDECKNVEAFEPIFWRLHLFLSVLLNGDKGVQSGGDPIKRENYGKVLSFLNSIKCSEDAVDSTKSKISHAICNLGLSIAKKLANYQSDISGMATSLTLPPTLYKPSGNTEGEKYVDNDENSWLEGDSVLAHFEALKFEDKEPASGSGVVKDEMVLEEKDGDGNEIPLGKMMQILKSQGSKKKKMLKRRTSPSVIKEAENEFDVLGVVREINLDNMKSERSMEMGELTKDNDLSESRWTSIGNGNEEVSVSRKREGTNGIAILNVPIPKRKRSVSMQKSPFKSTKGQSESRVISYSRSNKMDTKTKNSSSMEKDVESTSQDLVSLLPAIKSMLNKDSDESKKSTNLGSTDGKTDNSRRPKDYLKKRKIRRISGLEKCASHGTQLNKKELVGSRIKVWWPLDKAFYEGVVQSYDPGKKQHVILYDDGDIEVLNLEKEKWELVTIGDTPRKKQKIQQPALHKDKPLEKISKKSSTPNSRKNGNSPKKVRRKPAPKKHTVGSDVEGKADSDLSDAQSHSGSEVDYVSSDGDHEGNNAVLPPLEADDKIKEKTVETPEEALQEQRRDSTSLHGDEDSDDEPHNA